MGKLIFRKSKIFHFAIVIMLFTIEAVALAKPPFVLSAHQVNDCIYEYWSGRLKSGLISARSAVDLARSEFYPTITGTASTAKDHSLNPPIGAVNTGSIALNQQVLNISQLLSISAKSQDEKTAYFNFENEALNLMKAATQAYFEYLQQKSQEELLVKRTERLDKAVSLAKELNRLHISDESVILLAQSEKAQLEISLLNLRTSQNVAMNQMKASLGLSPNVSLEFDRNYGARSPIDPRYWDNKIEDLPDIQILKAKIESSRAEARSARFELAPTISVGATYTATYVEPLFRKPSTTVTGLLTWSLFDGGVRNIRSQKADSDALVYESQVISKKIQLLTDIKNILEQIDSGKKLVDLLKGKLELAQKAYSATWILFSLGKNTFLSVKDSEASLIDSEIQSNDATLKLAKQYVLLDLYNNYVGGRRQSALERHSCQLPIQ